MTDDADRLVWVTVEDATPDEVRKIGDVLESTSLTDRYEVVVSEDGIETLGPDDIQQLIATLQETATATGEEDEAND